MKKGLIVFAISLFISFYGIGQITLFGDTTNVFKSAPTYTPWRAWGVNAFHAVAYPAAMSGLNNIWYQGYPKTNFFWRNDNSHWMGLDKVGHFTATYRIGQISSNLYSWAGVEFKKAAFIGSIVGFATISSIEIFDGNSSNYGASWGDLGANLLGASFLLYQSTWDDPYAINFKLFTSKSAFIRYNPQQFGGSRPKQIFSDYNGQTYWLSFGMKKIVPLDVIPDWLNIAVGYGADGLIGQTKNPQFTEDGAIIPNFDRYRQYYLSLDIELRKIRTRYPFMNAVLKNVGFIKIPFPTLEFSKFGVKPYLYYL